MMVSPFRNLWTLKQVIGITHVVHKLHHKNILKACMLGRGQTHIKEYINSEWFSVDTLLQP